MRGLQILALSIKSEQDLREVPICRTRFNSGARPGDGGTTISRREAVMVTL